MPSSAGQTRKTRGATQRLGSTQLQGVNDLMLAALSRHAVNECGGPAPGISGGQDGYLCELGINTDGEGDLVTGFG
jgi:hypothetical protein